MKELTGLMKEMYIASQILCAATDSCRLQPGLPASRLAGNHTDAAPKHSLLCQFSFQVIGHMH